MNYYEEIKDIVISWTTGGGLAKEEYFMIIL